MVGWGGIYVASGKGQNGAVLRQRHILPVVSAVFLCGYDKGLKGASKEGPHFFTFNSGGHNSFLGSGANRFVTSCPPSPSD